LASGLVEKGNGLSTDVTGVAEARPLRADARRNRDALLAAAAAQFAERGVEAPLEDIARSAGVGIGTLYRHFPTRDALIADVYRREVELLCGGVDELLASLPADEALAEWMRRFVGYVATKRGLAVALKSMVNDNSNLFAQSRANINESMARLVHAAVEAGLVRPDAHPEDVLQAMSGFCMFNEQAGWQEQAQRLVNLLVDGLRFGVANSTNP
jgi:AcrR family transcriptional regulator